MSEVNSVGRPNGVIVPMSEPKFPGNLGDADVRKAYVSELIRDFWPHRMSTAAAEAIDAYYLRLATSSVPVPYKPKHRGNHTPDAVNDNVLRSIL